MSCHFAYHCADPVIALEPGIFQALVMNAFETPLTHGEQMYDEAFEPFATDTGTPYPCYQADIDFHCQKTFTHPNKNRFVSPATATEEMMRQNDKRRVAFSAEESGATRRLKKAVLNVKDGSFYSADLAIKIFVDLDIVFFGGHLRGNVLVHWVGRFVNQDWQNAHVLGMTRKHSDERGQCRIILDATQVLVSGVRSGAARSGIRPGPGPSGGR